jgi:hypothetical protein
VDAYAVIEQNRLKYLRLNKKKLCLDLYQGLQNAIVVSDRSAVAIGQKDHYAIFFHSRSTSHGLELSRCHGNL